MARFDFIDTLKGLLVIQRQRLTNHRGVLSRFYCAEAFKTAGLNNPIAQINHTLTKQQGAVRGLPFQYSLYAETKIISCVSGIIWNVAVDIRHDSPTFLQCYTQLLSAENAKSLLIPEGFAHGFQSLTPNSELIYLHTESYHPDAEEGLQVTDTRLNITWQLPIADLAQRDASHSFIDLNFQGIML